LKYLDLGGKSADETGIPNWLLRRAAGWAQKKEKTRKPECGNWWGGYPYGDDSKEKKINESAYIFWKSFVPIYLYFLCKF
jgi:hypothetical protein